MSVGTDCSQLHYSYIITLGGNAEQTFTDIKPVVWTSSVAAENENGGCDSTLSSTGSASVRYHMPADMTDGIMFKVNDSAAAWFSLSVEGTRKTSYGGLDNPVPADKKIYIIKTISETDTDTYRTQLWDWSIFLQNASWICVRAGKGSSIRFFSLPNPRISICKS